MRKPITYSFIDMKFTNLLKHLLFCIIWVQTAHAANIDLQQNNNSSFTLHSRHISTANGLMGNAINEMVQDPEGYIWIATSNGLSRFDGYSTVNYTSLACDDNHHLHARVGRTYLDSADSLLWLRTATFQIACYDLKHSRFVNWTGNGDCYKPFNKMMLTHKGMVIYAAGQGALLSHKTRSNDNEHSTTISITEFTRATSTLPDDNVLMVVEDSAGNVWLPTKHGIALNGSVIDSTHNIIAAGTGKRTLFLTKEGEVLVYNGERLEKSFSVPYTIGIPEKVNTSFVWQGQWMLFTPNGTYAIDTDNNTVSKPQQWQVTDGLDQGSCEGYHFIGTRKGVLWIFPDKDAPQSFELIDNAQHTTNKGWLFHVTKDHRNRLFIATYGAGLYVYDTENKALKHYSANDHSHIIGSNYLMAAMTDRQGNIWLGTETAGAYCLTVVDRETAYYTNLDKGNNGEWGNTVSTMMQTVDGTLYIDMRNGSTYTYSNNTVTPTDRQQTVAVNAHFIDSKNREWIGTWGNGLFIDGKHYSTADKENNIASDFINDIVESPDHNIWIATWNGGIIRYDHEGKMKQVMIGDINRSRINDLEITRNGVIWAATNDGVCLLTTDGRTKMFNTSNNLFPNDEAYSLLINDSTLWVATSGGVVRCKIENNVELSIENIYTTEQGLSNNNATAITRDLNGNIWVGTEDGISRIDVELGSVNSYRFAEMPQGNITSMGCAMTTAKGDLLFGTADGLLTINPQKFNNEATRKLLITNMTVNGKAHLADMPTTLCHTQNKLSLFFSCFDYNNLQRPTFQYYLEGVESEWQNTTYSNRADYNDLRPGSYTFHVRTLDSTGKWQNEATFSFTIMQPWYNRWWAWMLYVITVLLVVTYVYRNWRERFLLQQEMDMERKFNELRQNMFTNITHEFRTPLAIIKGAVDKLSEDGSNKTAQQTAKRATNRMLRMVNQFIEYRKIRTGNLRLQVTEGDLTSFIRDIISDIRIISGKKEQQITFLPTEKNMQATFDRQMIETIVYNLLSNAVKYTPERGDITVRLKKDGEIITLIIEDNGPGISSEQQSGLFKPFMNGYAARGGMGIGLYTAFEMAAIHKGCLKYERISDEGGSRFTIILPANDIYADEEHYEAISNDFDNHSDDIGEPLSEMKPESYNDYVVAIIEDDADMLEQIKTEVGLYFKTVTYSNGKDAIKGIEASIPTLVISDVMLPDMDGYEIVNRLKSNSNTASLPIIMLTALNDENHQIRAYKAGADDYMIKPCNFRLLIARAMQLIKWNLTATQQQNDRQQATAGNTAGQNTIIESRVDKVFLEKLEMFTNQHMSEPTFNVDRLAEMMNIGRTKFYGKVKELTGMSPNKYLQEARMRRASELLLEGEYSVSEVSFKVGIQDASYFNKMFKTHFGVVPSKYGR